MILLAFIGLSISGIVLIILEKHYGAYEIIALICAIIILLVTLPIFCFDFRRGVLFEKECLKVHADKKSVILRCIQHKVEISYENIQNLRIGFSKTDSNGKPLNVLRDIPYIVIQLKDGNIQAINVDFYNKKQRTQIIEEIKLRAQNVGNLIECPTGKDIWN